jgi:NADPH:quinone reductase-like Zn-dependent oxidoreductase
VSGTGLFACQMAKNIFKAGKVITTVSTAKVPKVKELLGDGVVDESRNPSLDFLPTFGLKLTLGIIVIDYTKSDPKSVIPQGSVDLLVDTIGASMAYLSLMRPKTGVIQSISLMPSGDVLQNSSLLRLSPDGQEMAKVPMPIRFSLNLLDRIRSARASHYSVTYSSMFLEPNAKDLDLIRQWIEEGKLQTVVGSTVHYKDLKAVQNACQVVYNAKGGVGKSVILFT